MPSSKHSKKKRQPQNASAPAEAALINSNYINRELSWLEFNQRVLDEAQDPAVPPLERLNFLAITSSNLDEFFMVRVGGLQTLVGQENNRPDPAGLTPRQQLDAISDRVRQMVADQYRNLDEIRRLLAEVGLEQVAASSLNERQRKLVEQVFENEIYPVLSPQAVSGPDDFPLVINLTISLCVRLAPAAEAPDLPRYAVIPFGRAAHRFITLPSDGGYKFILLEDVIKLFVERFFPGETVEECVPFRITRNADMGLREDLASDLLEEMKEVLDARKESDCVRLEHSADASSVLCTFLKETLDVLDQHTYALPGPLDLSAYNQLTSLPGFDHVRYEPWPPRPSPSVDLTMSLFDVIARQDVLLYHPYDSFEPVVRFIEEAALDPDVLAIKQTLYRTSRNSPIVAALIRAAERGKYVTVIVELKARFDEARNIEWALNLEQAGVQVIYGVKGLKTHAKICIVVRREPQGVMRYVHFGTGNYNEATARIYSDASFMTCNEDLGADATSFFNAVTGYSQPQPFRKIDAAPIGLRERLLELIESETERRRHGQRAHIIAKLNSLVDPRIIDALYAASQAGVRIDLNIRGICCLRPGVPGLSENITVISIVDRFLEHARIFYFLHGGDRLVYISSADWMPRNLDRRVELLVPIEDPSCRDRLTSILRAYFRDNVKARRLLPDGRYERVALPPEGGEPFRSQEVLYRDVCDAVKQEEQSRRTVFEPHRAAENGT